MREHKFRGQRKDNGELVYGCYCQIGGMIPCILPENVPINIDSRGQYIERTKFIEVDPATVGEFTGKRDSKRTKEYPEGQEIYENDKDAKGDHVIWNPKYAGFCLKHDKHDDISLEDSETWFVCAGTIHDGPEYGDLPTEAPAVSSSGLTPRQRHIQEDRR